MDGESTKDSGITVHDAAFIEDWRGSVGCDSTGRLIIGLQALGPDGSWSPHMALDIHSALKLLELVSKGLLEFPEIDVRVEKPGE